MLVVERGLRLGQWVLDERIGTGGLAEVWRALPAGEGRPVAAKILVDPGKSATHRRRFLREGRLLQTYEHAGLPRCLAILEDPHPVLILELLEGETLAERLAAEGPQPAERVEAVAAALLGVLDHLHRHRILHRDIKPSNVWLGEDRRVLLLDLGLAADPTDALTTTLGDVLGTYAYMAPEQISGAEVDARADLYSLGLTLYEALSGSRPFVASGAAGYLHAHRVGHHTSIHELRPDAPRRVLDTVARLMARDPQGRPPSAPVARAMLLGDGLTAGPLRSPPLIGRAAARGAIEGLLDAGGRLCIEGPLGSGIGRLALYAVTEARRRHAEVLVIRCRTRAPTSSPLDQLARDLSQMSGAVDATPEAIARSLEALTGEGDVLVLIEDADACEERALQVLHELFDRVPDLRVLSTGRAAPGPGHRVRLRTLLPGETAALVAAMLGTSHPPAGLVEHLHRTCDGLPALVVLAVRDLVQRKALWGEGVGEDGTPLWRSDPASMNVPLGSLRRLFSEALDAAGPDAHRLLRMLSVLGEAIPVYLAGRLAELSPVEPAAHELAAQDLARLTDEAGEPWISVARPTIAEVVVAGVPEAERRAAHRRFAALLEAEPASRWRDSRLAWHRAHGVPKQLAVAALLDLGELLIAERRDEDALDVLHRAAKEGAADPADAARLAVCRGEALIALGRTDEATSALAAATHLARDLADRALTVRGLVAAAEAGLHHDALEAQRRCEDALRQLEASPDDPAVARATALLSEALRLLGEPMRAKALAQSCLHPSGPPRHPETDAVARGVLGALEFESGRLHRAAPHRNQQLAWLRRQGRTPAFVAALVCGALIARCAGRVDEAEALLAEGDDAARFASTAWPRLDVLLANGGLAMAVGDRAGAREALDQAGAARDDHAPLRLRLAYRELQGDLRLRFGDSQAALASYGAALIAARDAHYHTRAAYFEGMVGVLTADRDALGRAMDVLSVAGQRRHAARLLLEGALAGGDAEVLASAEAEARDAGDAFLLLEVLHASGSAVAQREALAVATAIVAHLPERRRGPFLASAPARWSGARDHPPSGVR